MPLPKKMPRGRNSKQEEGGRVYANRYKVIKRLGSGSFGTVFLVEDMKANAERKVLKEIYVGELQPDETVDAMREAKLLSKLNHPNIVKFMDSFIDREFFCIVTEYCEGGDLDDKIQAWRKAGKAFDESLILAWFIQIVLAVQNMHEKRILHRDLKARNIFLKNNIIKLGDFGISRILMGTSDMATTFTGTPYYMSPEVLKHEGYNHKSDIWSLGVVLYELCNLQHAFQGQSLMGVMYKIVEGESPKLSGKYSKELQDFYTKLLDKDPKLRPSAAEILKYEYIAQHMKKLKIQMNSRLSASIMGDRNTQGSSVQRPKTRSGKQEGKKLYKEPDCRPLTPMDKLKLRKQQKADEEAERIKLFMANQAPETHAQYSFHKKKQKQVSLPWVDDHPDVFSDPTFTLTASHSMEFTPPTSPTHPDMPGASNGNGRTWGTDEAEDSFSLTMVSEIPDDAELAETFYSQFEHEFEEDSDGELGEDDGEEDEYSALVGRMEDALEHSAVDVDATLSDDVIGQALTSSMREQRIDALRAECIKLLGPDAFKRAYNYLQDARFGDEFRNEDSIMDGLGKIVKTPRDCFLVDQLLFMEKQAEIAAMT